MQETINMRGQLTLRLTNKTGQLIHEQHPKNRIVTSGRQLVAQLFSGFSDPAPSPITTMGVGTDGTTTADSQTDLLAARPITADTSHKEIASVDYSIFTENPGTDTEVQRVRVLLTTEFELDEANGDAPLQEAAIFNEAGVMYNRVVFAPVTKTDAFRLTLLWEIVF
ncbi:MAG: hypothetical protein ACFBSF_08310 [Leptolyngbyaceae cyanobacterium]